MKLLGLIGHPVSHSRSPEIFQQFFKDVNEPEWEYRLFDLAQISELPELILSHPDLIGLNVTVPHKTAIIPLLNDLSDEANSIGAVNTVTLVRKNSQIHLKGYNTDVYGFERALNEAFNRSFRNALILGTGGSSKAVVYALHKKGVKTTLVSRGNPQSLSYKVLTEKTLEPYDLIVNTTPLGMSPDINSAPPLQFNGITQNHCCFDLVYNPMETEFLKRCKEQGAQTAGGLEMLRYQAEKSWELIRQVSG